MPDTTSSAPALVSAEAAATPLAAASVATAASKAGKGEKAGKAPGAAGKRSVKPAAAAAAKQAPAAREAKPKKPKLVRDSFTIPKEEYAAIEGLKQRLALQGAPAKKSELLRAGLVLLASLPDAALAKAMQAIPSIKTGRPKSEPAGTAIGAKPAKAPKARADGKA
ncbi:hypothetical protein [Paracidovorax citrulli]|uniref:Uncharacterized protein n=2 Tax=Paracidovorax citrulli TaxID=80869 RepID=A1TQF8_PARC0|nr:hypothetical protein [Paracidovorax citrulli]ABM33196.1 conserved hypothetical protein [Paracidovorax citrulli AAC00-1]ATG92865.1 hypothetical protein CQB05_01415 [Paracidovorax citrulli]PVY67426.1 hypothetical protein C8E08_4870 [Paracidovorax citrulli]QCX13083.1 hypothetical protein APS58_4399 [Paracidovorax citrulli]REG68415.1 hypothetical protein C8E07_1522 [Paracidovorax citrulli]